MTGVRIDRWLWAARFFKTRSREVRVGDMLQVKNAGGEYEIEVLLLSETRGPAAVAQTLFRETERSQELRLKAAQERREAPRWDAWPEGRPSKRDRRELDHLRGRG